ncbi:MAG TPA: OmpA family protein [Bryobacteraceae bacterium]|nr:OmpA family protein [Bryobacteraceae bacterium]
MGTKGGNLRGTATGIPWVWAAVLVWVAVPGCGLREFDARAPAARESLCPPPEEIAERFAREVADVYFRLNSHSVDARAREILVRNAGAMRTMLKEHRNLVIVIEGHCDDRGPTDYNLTLGRLRAEAVRRVLEEQGVPAGRLRVTSAGHSKPQCTMPDEDCRRKNRRVHFRAARVTGSSFE